MYAHVLLALARVCSLALPCAALRTRAYTLMCAHNPQHFPHIWTSRRDRPMEEDRMISIEQLATETCFTQVRAATLSSTTLSAFCTCLLQVV